MATPINRPQNSLHVRRTFTSRRDEIFAAWTQAEKVVNWLGRPDPRYESKVHELDVRVGGKYRIEIRSPEGKLHVVHGTYKEVRPPEKLVFTWAWENDPGFGETLVSIDFLDKGGATEMVLNHDFFASAEARNSHEKGWAGCLDTLVKTL